jgi:hypothetical protein
MTDEREMASETVVRQTAREEVVVAVVIFPKCTSSYVISREDIDVEGYGDKKELDATWTYLCRATLSSRCMSKADDWPTKVDKRALEVMQAARCVVPDASSIDTSFVSRGNHVLKAIHVVFA